MDVLRKFNRAFYSLFHIELGVRIKLSNLKAVLPLNGNCPSYLDYSSADNLKFGINIEPFNNNDTVEVPCIASVALLLYRQLLAINKDLNSSGLIIQQFLGGSSRINRASPATVMDSLLSYRYNNAIKTVIYEKKGERYYGNNSIIMDSNENILLLITVEQSIDEGFIVQKNPKVYVNPRVFKNLTGINLYIVKYLIPYFLEEVYTVDGKEYKVTIELSDPATKFLVLPEKFKKANLNEDINNFLANNKDLLTRIFKLEDA